MVNDVELYYLICVCSHVCPELFIYIDTKYNALKIDSNCFNTYSIYALCVINVHN